MKVVLITPTHKVGSEGYYEAKIQEADSTPNGFNLTGKPWHSDSVHLYGELQMDFENKGNIVVWNTDDKILVREAYTTKIYGGEEAINNWLKK